MDGLDHEAEAPEEGAESKDRSGDDTNENAKVQPELGSPEVVYDVADIVHDNADETILIIVETFGDQPALGIDEAKGDSA